MYRQLVSIYSQRGRVLLDPQAAAVTRTDIIFRTSVSQPAAERLGRQGIRHIQKQPLPGGLIQRRAIFEWHAQAPSALVSCSRFPQNMACLNRALSAAVIEHRLPAENVKEKYVLYLTYTEGQNLRCRLDLPVAAHDLYGRFYHYLACYRKSAGDILVLASDAEEIEPDHKYYFQVTPHMQFAVSRDDRRPRRKVRA